MALTRVRRTGLNDGLVSDAKLDSGVGTQAVTTSTIRNGAVTTLKIADNSITTAKLSSSGGLEAIDTTVLRDGAVTPPKVDTTATFSFNAVSVATALSVTGKVSRDDASGTDVSGSDIVIAGGASTGSASGGFIRLKTSPAGGSTGSSLNALTDALVITGQGKIGIGVGNPTEDLEVANNVVINGNLNVLGATTTVSTTNTVIGDKLIELGNGVTGTPSGDAGIVIERGTGDNAFIGYDESEDKFALGTGSFTGITSGDLTYNTGTLLSDLEATHVTVSGASSSVTFDGAVVTMEPVGSNVALFKLDATNNKIGIGQDPNNALAQILQVNGTVGATAFVGDGNGLTNLSGFTGAGDGTESIPGISFFLDQDNGFYRPSSDQMGLCLGGDEKIRYNDQADSLILVKDIHGQDAGSATTATIAAAVIDSFAHADYSSGKYVVQVKSGAYVQAKEVLIMHDGTDIFIEEYATMTSGSLAQGALGTITAQFNGANIEIVFTPTYAVNTIKYYRSLVRA